MSSTAEVYSERSAMWYGSLFYLGFWGLVGIYEPFLNVYLAQLGLSGQQIGILAALLPLMFLLAAPAVSVPADRFARRRQTMRLGLIGLAATLVIFWIPQSFWLILLLTAVLALFRAPIAPIADGVLTRMSVRHRLNFGRMRLWGSVGFAVAAVIGGSLWQRVGFVPMFVAAGLTAVPLFFVAGRLEEEAAVQQHVDRAWIRLLHHRGMLTILAASFLIGGYIGMTFTFEGVYLNQLGGSELVVGLFFGLGAFFELPAMQFSDRIAQRFSRPAALIMAYGLLFAANLGKAVAPTPELFLSIGVLKGLGFGLFFVTTVRLVDEQTPEGWGATAQGVLNAVLLGIAPLIATPIGGWIFDRFGAVWVFTIAALLALLAAGVIGTAVLGGVFRQEVG